MQAHERKDPDSFEALAVHWPTIWSMGIDASPVLHPDKLPKGRLFYQKEILS